MTQSDDSSIMVTLNLDDDKKRQTKTNHNKDTASNLSSAKLAQLADAREKSIASRRLKMKEKLERKLDALHVVMGNLRSDQIERVAQAMLDQEEQLRAKQNMLTDELRKQIRALHDEVRTPKRRPDDSRQLSSNATAVSSVHSRHL